MKCDLCGKELDFLDETFEVTVTDEDDFEEVKTLCFECFEEVET